MYEAPANLVKKIKNKTIYFNPSENYDILFSIHALKTNMSEVKIIFHNDMEAIFPAGSFVRGTVYNITFKEIIFNENDCDFNGYFYTPKY